MISAYTRKTAPSTAVLTIEGAKRHFRFFVVGEDAEIARYIAAATQWVEDYTGRSLMRQTWQMSVSGWWTRLSLPRAAPLGAVSFVKYYDPAGTLQTLSASAYQVPAFHEPASLRLSPDYSLPALMDRPDAVLIEYTTGHEHVRDVPPALVQAVAVLTAFWFDHRSTEATGDETEAAQALCAPHRLALLEAA